MTEISFYSFVIILLKIFSILNCLPNHLKKLNMEIIILMGIFFRLVLANFLNKNK